MVQRVPTSGFLSRAVRNFFPSLANVKGNDEEFKRALQVARRCHDKFYKGDGNGDDFTITSTEKPTKRFCAEGAGRKVKATEVRQAMFKWFIDVRGSLKGHLPKKIFKAKCEELYQSWLSSQDEKPPKEEQLQFSNQWIRGWMREFGVSLSKPNKRFSVSFDDRKERIIELIQNVYRVHYHFVTHFKKEPVIINGDQMPLHRNESSTQATMTLKNQPMYVKENYMLSREHATVYTQLSTEESNPMPTPVIVFKGKGTRIHLEPPAGMTVHWGPKGSYRLETMLDYIGNLKNRFNIFTQKNNALYILDNFSVHCQSEVKQKLLQRGYIPVIMGGGITGDPQTNDTHLHHQLKAKYQYHRSELMLQKLCSNPEKIPNPTRDEMMRMLYDSWNEIDICATKALKHNFLLNKLDGSEDYLVTDKLMSLVGDEVKAFRQTLLQTPPPKTLEELLKSFTPPKGVTFRDEGKELLDCEGDEIAPINPDELSDDEADDGQVDDGQQSMDTGAASGGADSSELKQTHLVPETDDEVGKDSAYLNDMDQMFEKHSSKTSISLSV